MDVPTRFFLRSDPGGSEHTPPTRKIRETSRANGRADKRPRIWHHERMGTGVRSDQGRAVFYRFTDSAGRIHIVDSLDLVPSAARAHAERVQYEEQAPATVLSRVTKQHGTWPLVAGGAGVALLAALLFRRSRGSAWFVLRAGLVAGALALMAGAYFGSVRRSTLGKGDVLAAPSALIDDAKSAVEKMNLRLRAEQAELKEAEQAK